MNMMHHIRNIHDTADDHVYLEFLGDGDVRQQSWGVDTNITPLIPNSGKVTNPFGFFRTILNLREAFWIFLFTTKCVPDISYAIEFKKDFLLCIIDSEGSCVCKRILIAPSFSVQFVLLIALVPVSLGVSIRTLSALASITDHALWSLYDCR